MNPTGDATKDCLNSISETIEAHLKNDLIPDESCLHYINSTFLTPDLQTISAILHGEEYEAESACLLELLFFPDEPIKHMMESLLDTFTERAVTSDDEKNLIESLTKKNIQTRIVIEKLNGHIPIFIPVEIIGRYVERLCIKRKIGDSLNGAINDAARKLAIEGAIDMSAVDIGLKIKMMLRHMTKPFNENKEKALVFFLKKYVFSDFFKAFTVLLEFFGETAESDLTGHEAFYALLMAKKRSNAEMIRKAKKMDELLAKDNMETLMMKGERFIGVDRKAAREKISAIDGIAFALFGKTEFTPVEPVVENVEISDLNKAGEFFNRL